MYKHITFKVNNTKIPHIKYKSVKYKNKLNPQSSCYFQACSIFGFKTSVQLNDAVEQLYSTLGPLFVFPT